MKPYFAFQWHITDACDQRCQHCYIYAEGRQTPAQRMAFAEMEMVVSGCVDFCTKLKRTPYIYLTGGDPILHPDFWELCALLKEMNIDFGILGNPFHLDDAVCQRLARYGCKKYQLSLDGLEQTHDRFRKPGSFQSTLRKIACIRNAGMYSAVMTTVSGANLDEIPELIDTVVGQRVDVYAFGRYCPTSQQKRDTYHIEPLRYRAFLETVWQKFDQYQDSKTTFNLKDHLWTLFLYEKGLFTIPNQLEDGVIYDGCHCGIGHMTVLPNGDVTACRRMESTIGNVFETSLYDLFLSDRLDAYRRFSQFGKCCSCDLLRFCRGCPAVAYGYTGNMYAPDPQCWAVTVE